MKSKKNTYAILAIDPGGTTGVAAGYVELGDTRRETLETMTNNKTTEVTGDYLWQAAKLDTIFRNFVFTANVEYGIPLPNISIAIEDFVLRRRREGGATGNLTSCWVAAAAVAMFHKVMLATPDGKQITAVAADQTGCIHWQTASDAKHVANDARLKSYGLWIVGSAHERDANRHLVLRVDKILQGG